MKETAELPEDPVGAAPRRHLSPPLFALLIVPFGIVLGYVQVTLPYVFSVQLQGDPDATTKIAAFQAIALQPHSFKFIIEPALDARWRKKSWFLVSVAVTAIFFVVSI